jgi:sugar lactone lactonase YvrE
VNIPLPVLILTIGGVGAGGVLVAGVVLSTSGPWADNRDEGPAALLQETASQTVGDRFVTTLAGSSEGHADGLASVARFSEPTAIAVDSAGNVYVADFANHRIRKIDPQGNVSTLAGSGVAGYADGPGDKAQFNGPAGVAVDRSGNVYVSDALNYRIRRIGPDGTVTTIAGSGPIGVLGVGGFADGPAATARFAAPAGLAVDASGNVYVADKDNHRVRRISPDGIVTTVAGSGREGTQDGSRGQAQLTFPVGLAIDEVGNLYFTQHSRPAVRRVSADGEVTTLLIRPPGTALAGVAVSGDGTVFFVESSSHAIYSLAPGGQPYSVAGSGSCGKRDGPGAVAMFSNPTGLALGPRGELYVADHGNHQVRKVER